MNLFVFGLGYSAMALVRNHRARFGDIAGTVRTREKAGKLLRSQPAGAPGFKVHTLDLAAKPVDIVDAALARNLIAADAVLASVPPTEAGEPALEQLRSLLVRARPRWIGYFSTVGVYGDHGGNWVDETSPAITTAERSLRRLRAEEGWLALAAEIGARGFVFRLPGIYGPGRNVLCDLAARTARNIDKPGQVFNRIHVDDIANAVAATLPEDVPGGIYNVSDDEPAAQGDVLLYAGRLMSMRPPLPVPLEEADLSPMARSFYNDNKRIRNGKLKALPGFSLHYPTYREGLQALWDSGEGYC